MSLRGHPTWKSLLQNEWTNPAEYESLSQKKLGVVVERVGKDPVLRHLALDIRSFAGKGKVMGQLGKVFPSTLLVRREERDNKLGNDFSIWLWGMVLSVILGNCVTRPWRWERRWNRNAERK